MLTWTLGVWGDSSESSMTEITSVFDRVIADDSIGKTRKLHPLEKLTFNGPSTFPGGQIINSHELTSKS